MRSLARKTGLFLMEHATIIFIPAGGIIDTGHVGWRLINWSRH
jgi:hypothetical protein